MGTYTTGALIILVLLLVGHCRGLLPIHDHVLCDHFLLHHLRAVPRLGDPEPGDRDGHRRRVQLFI